MYGKPISGSLPESIRLFMLCEAMNWAHLPVQGGIYDQHPQLIDEFIYLFQLKAKHDKEQAARKQSKSQAAKAGTGKPTRRGR